MKRALLLAACVALALAGRAEGEPVVLALERVGAVDGLKVADIDGDGLADLLILEGRELRVWRGRKGALPAAAPVWTAALPAGASFVDALPGESPCVLAVGTDGAARLALEGKEPREARLPQAPALPWRDTTQAVFADLRRGAGVLLPLPDGWRFTPGSGAPVELRLSPYRDVQRPGPFLEDTCTVVQALPEVFVGVAAPADSKASAIWAIDGQTLAAQTADARVTYDLSFLGAEAGAEFDQTLVDLDGDGRPDVLHRIHTNRETRYGFFHTRPVTADSPVGPSHKPATSALFLSGFQLEPDLVDLDGDGLKDLVVTSMQINAPNMLGALTSGRVTAETRAFLNRWHQGKGLYFDAEPDAVVRSQIGVAVQFNYAGNIEVVRSFTILLDGDFDGDGRKDLLIRTGPDELTIRRGTGAGVWGEEKDAVTVKIPPKANHPDIDGTAADLDGDGKDEIVLVYRSPPGGKDVVRILDLDP